MLPDKQVLLLFVGHRNIASLQRQRTAALLDSHIVSRSPSPAAQRPYSVAGVPSDLYIEPVPARPQSTTPSRSVSFTPEKTKSRRTEQPIKLVSDFIRYSLDNYAGIL